MSLDYDYCRVFFTGNPEFGSRSAVMIHNGYEQMEIRINKFQKYLQGFLDSRHGSLCFKSVTSSASIYITLKPDPNREGADSLQLPWWILKGYVFPAFCLNGHALLKVQVDNATIILMCPVWQAQLWYTKVLQMSIHNLILIPQKKQAIAWSEFPKILSWSKQNITNSSLGGLRENMRAEGLSQGRTGTYSHYELTWIKWDSRYNRRSLDSFRCDVNPILV